MSEMVERVAKALGESVPGLIFPDAWPWETMARAALEAMREPTDEMARIGLYLTEGSDPDFKDIWRQMINKALK